MVTRKTPAPFSEPLVEKHPATRPAVYRPELPERFRSGGATAEELAAWKRANWQGEHDDDEQDATP